MTKMKKIIANIMTGIVALSSVVFTGCAGDETGNVPVPPPSTEQTGQSSGFDVSGSQESGISLLTATIAETDYETYGVSVEAESAITVTASYTPEYVTNPELDWEVSFVDETSEWAMGKIVIDYVTVTPTEDGATTAVVECFAPFGEKIKVIVSSRTQTDIKAEVIFNYKPKITRVSARAVVYNEDYENAEDMYYPAPGMEDVTIDFALLDGVRLSVSDRGQAFRMYYEYGVSAALANVPPLELSLDNMYDDIDWFIDYNETIGTLTSSVKRDDMYQMFCYTMEFEDALREIDDDLFFVYSANRLYSSYPLYRFFCNTMSSISLENVLLTSVFNGYRSKGKDLTSDELLLYSKFSQLVESYIGKPIGSIFVFLQNGAVYARPIVLTENIFQIEMQSVSVDTTAYTF